MFEKHLERLKRNKVAGIFLSEPVVATCSSRFYAREAKMPMFCSAPRPVVARAPRATARRAVVSQVASHPMDPSVNLADFKCVLRARLTLIA